MSCLKCGIDIVSLDRIAKLLERRGTGNLSRIWTASEINDCTRSDGSVRVDSLAGRYAAKEAVSKAFGTGFGRDGVNFEEIEIQKGKYGAPFIVLYGTTKEFFEKSNYAEISISLSHTEDTAVAMCVITEKEAKT